MLSYQHHYHAGNHADILKHWLLLECIHHMQKKAQPFEYIDTHAGAGLYRLDSAQALKTGESANGILKLDFARLSGMEHYHNATADDLQHNRYPGSPMLAKRLLRSGDKAWLFEKHPQTITELRRHCAQKRVCHVQEEDGLQGLLGRLPTSSRRAVVLIDPSYEVKTEYDAVIKTAIKAYQKMPQAMLLLWYPVVERSRITAMEKALKKSHLRDVHLFEMGVDDDDKKGMNSSGMIAVNPPWTLAERFQQVMPAVSQQLSLDNQSRCRYRLIVAE